MKPSDGERVEILVNGQWIPATFHAAGSFLDGDEDEAWWMDYFELESGEFIPEDVQRGDVLPEWRREHAANK
jgi:hypothetical protein